MIHLQAGFSHGGVGMITAGLRAGKPTLVRPYFGAHPFWGERIHTLGIGPAPTYQKRLTVEALATALRAFVSGISMHRNALELGEKIQSENGIANAIAVITTVIKERHAQILAPA